MKCTLDIVIKQSFTTCTVYIPHENPLSSSHKICAMSNLVCEATLVARLNISASTYFYIQILK